MRIEEHRSPADRRALWVRWRAERLVSAGFDPAMAERNARPRAARGSARALTGAVAGVVFGPPGIAAGFVGGGIAGSVSEEHPGPRLRSAFFDEVRTDVPEGS